MLYIVIYAKLVDTANNEPKTLLEIVGFEPTTYDLQSRRSPEWAKPPL